MKTKEELRCQLEALHNSGANVSASTELDKLVSQKRKWSYYPSYKGVPQKNRKARYPYHAPKYHLDHQVGRALTTIPKSYTTDVLNFVTYLADTAGKSFTIKGIDRETGEETVRNKPYVHRWTEIYMRGFLCKMYQLENALHDDIRDVTMITLTVRHTGKTAEDCIYLLREKWTKLRKVLHYYFGTIDFFRAFEAHESGYPHMHVMYMRYLDKETQESLKRLWCEKYEMGSKVRGVHFLSPKRSSDGSFDSGSIGRIRGYLMKYIGKSLSPKSDDPDYDYNLSGKTYKLKYAPKQLLFNSLLKKTKTRLWGASRNFSKIMAPIKALHPNWECLSVTQMKGDEIVNVVWDKEAGSYPAGRKVWKWYSTVPSWGLEGSKFVERLKLKGFKFEEFEQLENNALVKFTRIFEPVWEYD